MIVHRARRDIQRCRERYGEAWKEYEKRVPWLFIPVSFPLPSYGTRKANMCSMLFEGILGNGIVWRIG